MSFREPYFSRAAQPVVADEVTEAATIRNALVQLQTDVRNLNERICRLAQAPPSDQIITTMRGLLTEGASAMEKVEAGFKEWREGMEHDAVQRKLILPKLEAGFQVEVQKFRECESTVAKLEQNWIQQRRWTSSPSPPSGSSYHSSNRGGNGIIIRATPSDDHQARSLLGAVPPSSSELDALSPLNGFADLPLRPPGPTDVEVEIFDSIRPDRDGLPCVQSSDERRLFPLSSASMMRFYEDVDHDYLPPQKATSSDSASTTTGGGSQSPPSSESRYGGAPIGAPRHAAPLDDDFLRDDFLESQRCATSEEDDEELSGLLSRGSVMSASYLEGWQLDEGADELGVYVSKEKLRGIQRIKFQLGQAAHLFKELAQLINEQKDDLDVLDAKMGDVKGSTNKTVQELRKANAQKQRTRRRNFFFALVTVVAGLIVFLLYALPGSSAVGSSGAAPSDLVEALKLRSARSNVAVPKVHHHKSALDGTAPLSTSESTPT